MRWRAPVLTAMLGSLMLATQAQPKVPAPEAEILRQVGEAYRKLDHYLLEGTIRVDVRGGRAMSQEAPFFVAVDGKGRMRDEVASTTVGGMIVSDGRHTVMYNVTLGQYVRRAGAADSVLKAFNNKGVGNTLIARYAGVATGATDAKRLPDETVSLDQGKRDCLVLEVTYPPPNPRPQVQEMPRVFWIDKQTHLVVRQRTLVKADMPQMGGKVEQEENVTFRRALIDPPLPDSLWVFRPPPGSREVAEFVANRPEEGNGFTGKPAIDFTLKDLKGRAHGLKALRGKTVLLDFWATWCGPCRLTMPQVAKIHAEYRNRGVEVMSINVGETAAMAGAYIAKNGYAFTTLLDQDRAVSTSYRVNGIPTLVVIDRAGKVSDYLVGARDDVALRAALKKAGVK